ncbi:DUF4091 domain-containing protein [Paenibacillus ginsengarvi]|uniref:DUF4091 domain-containing protein n=1 Tax=Paenibacillus ginsengarvi TaxID=400777 RepID=A0A3B0CMH8_9BACL|nr:DUF4091 domain-containing protein [Paenibacillus ginsengarvi]RKN85597.1 DUF4091 domain-containing protein [Paenibacillus ginsengarvi]
MTIVQQPFMTRSLSSLEKVFADEPLQAEGYTRASALRGETFSYQVAYRSERLAKHLKLRVESDLASRVTVRTVGLVPAEMPIYHDHDDNVLRSEPGLYPDPLMPLTESEGVTGYPKQWRSVWVTVDLDGDVAPGTYPITLVFLNPNDQELSRETFELDVLALELPKQKLIHTEWFHTDCLATYYEVEVFSERYWEIVEHYVNTAVRHGINMLLTPLFTPPLDTQVGGERPTVQLVDVEKSGSEYRFGFDKLKRWVDMCDRCGVVYFEMSHLFTQWGAKHAPKIVAAENGETKRIFGWDTDATGDEYKSFLGQFLPQLVGFIKQNGLSDRVYFHVSDEPHTDHLPWYESASSWLKQFVGEFPTIDALSSYQFYEKGLVPNPIPASNHIQPFLDGGVPDLWTYYCCSQYKKVANRFMCMPSARNRVLGLQLYKFRIAGFLHWGYNFWYAQYSRFPIDPYRNTDANFAFPAGDPFVVYPGADGKPVESLRFEVFREALQDLRALTLLESLIGREKTVALIEEGAEAPITFDVYPQDAAWLLACRERINAAIRANSAV